MKKSSRQIFSLFFDDEAGFYSENAGKKLKFSKKLLEKTNFSGKINVVGVFIDYYRAAVG